MSTPFIPANRAPGFKAGADFSALTEANKYIALTLDADGDVNTAGAGEQDFIGFLQNAPKEDAAAEVAIVGGGSKAVAAGNITAGDFLKSDSNGHMLAISSETANAVAFALESAADNDVLSVLVLAPGHSVIIA